jgi:murein DD-endopeptidase MepM/ murein hydrolase activator NlpD
MVLNFTHLASAAVAVLVGSGAASAELRHGPTLLPPVAGACISSPFGPRVLPNRPQAGIYHYGVDLPAAAGAPVLAIAAGTVIRIQDKGPGGLEMLVQHDGFLGIYSHFGVVAPAFAEGKRTVAAGEKLGVVGTTGVTTGAHLYFQMDLAGKPVDPAPYLGVRPCNGETASIDRMDTDEKIVGTRTVHVLLPVAQPYQLPRQ